MSRPAGGCSGRTGGSTSATSDASARLRLEALARYLQDVATDDADDAGLSDRDAASGSSARPTSSIVRLPWYHEAVELTTFCSGIGPRWAERRTIVSG